MNWYKKAQSNNKKPITGTPYTAVLYKGISKSGPVDEGMYGKGNYYAPERNVAEGYATDFGDGPGEVISKEITLHNPLVITYADIDSLKVKAIINSPEFKNKTFAKMSELEKREFSSQKITEEVKKSGHDGIIIVRNNGTPVEVVDLEIMSKGNYELV